MRTYAVTISLLTTTLAHSFSLFFFFNDTATTEIYTLSLHDALPIYPGSCCRAGSLREPAAADRPAGCETAATRSAAARSEEHTSELQSRRDLVCRLLLEKKKKNTDRALLFDAMHDRIAYLIKCGSER